MDSVAPTADALGGPESMLRSAERDRVVQRALGQLDERCQGLLRLLYATTPTPSYAEIAASLGIAVGTIDHSGLWCCFKHNLRRDVFVPRGYMRIMHHLL